LGDVECPAGNCLVDSRAVSLPSLGRFGLCPTTQVTLPGWLPRSSRGTVTRSSCPMGIGQDDSVVGGQHEFGMAPEIVVRLEGELEDLNVEPLTMDRECDSPPPPSLTQMAVLDSVVQADVAPDTIAEILPEVPSAQLTSSPPRREPSPRVVFHKFPKPETASEGSSGMRLPPPPKPAPSAPTPALRRLGGRGLLPQSRGGDHRPAAACRNPVDYCFSTSVYC